MRTVAVDSGGTFTDVVAFDDGEGILVSKVPSTPEDPAVATSDGFRRVARGTGIGELRHGTTVATNALLERKGAATALLTTAGFEDVLEIARQRRPDPYDQFAQRPDPLVPRQLRFGVPERVDHVGAILHPLDEEALARIVDEVAASGSRSVAVVLLHSYVEDAHERRIAQHLARRGFDSVFVSSEVCPEFREYERTSTTVLYAYLAPGLAGYLGRLDSDPDLPDPVLVMRSAGGLGRAADLARRPGDALLSGPAAGVLAAAAVASAAGQPDAISFDMGGTSTDVCLIEAGTPAARGRTEVGGLPCLSPSLAVHTVGAGGGSIARLDPAGALLVGPDSAGAVPGPACYARGGTEPTVTDANAALGRVRTLAAGSIRLDLDSARTALDRLGPGAAEAVIDVVEANMEQALRAVTVHRGVDPAELALVAFGGAGGLHAAALCRTIGARVALVPPCAGVLSALGLLTAPVRADRARTHRIGVEGFTADLLTPLAHEAAREVDWAGQPVLALSVDCRYGGQSHEIRVRVDPRDTPEELAERFHRSHERLNGYRRDGASIEIVTLRAGAEVQAPSSPLEVLRAAARSLPARLPEEVVEGPHLVEEAESCTWIPPGFSASTDEIGNIVIQPPGTEG